MLVVEETEVLLLELDVDDVVVTVLVVVEVSVVVLVTSKRSLPSCGRSSRRKLPELHEAMEPLLATSTSS